MWTWLLTKFRSIWPRRSPPHQWVSREEMFEELNRSSERYVARCDGHPLNHPEQFGEFFDVIVISKEEYIVGQIMSS
jgi:hypothetical protein